MISQKLEGKKPDFKVVAMPDFYLDYLVSYPGKMEDLTSDLANVARRGGGNIVGWKHLVGRGGNAANLIAQLAALEVDVIPIIETDYLGHAILEKSLPGVDLSHIRTTGTLSSTLSLEVDLSGRRVNIMASNPGSHSNFGPERLTEEDKELIRGANFVCILNWGKNERGTELAESVFQLGRRGGAITFFDPADPTPMAGHIQDLNERVLTSGLVDVLSVNESELLQLAPVVTDEYAPVGEGPLFEAASFFSMLAVRVDLHTLDFSATFIDGQRVRVPCLKLNPLKVTGAGDVWDAADIYAQGMKLDHTERLVFANAAAAAYLKRPGLEPSTLEEILKEAEPLEKLTERQKL